MTFVANVNFIKKIAKNMLLFKYYQICHKPLLRVICSAPNYFG